MAVVYSLSSPFDREWHRDTVVGTGLGAVGFGTVAASVALLRGPAAGGRFLVAGGGVLLALALAGVAARRRSQVRPGLTLATGVTLVRGLLVAVFAGLLAAVGLPDGGPVAWVPGLVFGLAAALDRVDGWLARRRDAETRLGARLDTETDAMLVLVGAVTVVSGGLAPAAFLAVGAARYLFLAGHTIRRSRGWSVRDEQHRWLNRTVYAAVTVTIWGALLPATDASVTRPLLAVVAVPFLLNFIRSWLATRG